MDAKATVVKDERGRSGGNFGHRSGAVTSRIQFQRHRHKRDERTGHLRCVEDDSTPFKGIARESDGGETPNA